MKNLTKSKIVMSFAVIFAAGGITGGVFALGNARQRAFVSPSPKKICAHFRDKLQSRLNLTDDQLSRIQPILDRRVNEMEEIHTRSIEETEKVIHDTNLEIAQLLTAGQQEELEKMENERREFWQKHTKEFHLPPP